MIHWTEQPVRDWFLTILLEKNKTEFNLNSDRGCYLSKVPTLDEVLTFVKEKVLFNWDKWQTNKEKVLEIIRKV